MICKNCGKDTAYVICENCGVNVVWYNKYGQLHDEENPGELNLLSYLNNKDNESKMKIDDFVQEVFNPDGSGD